MFVFRVGRTYTYEFEFQKRRYRRGGFPARALAQDAGDAHRRGLQEGRIERIWGVRARGRLTDVPRLRDYVANHYLPAALPGLAPLTQKTRRAKLERVCDLLGERLLSELTPAALDQWAATRLQAVKVSTLREERAALSMVCSHAVSRGVLAGHPFLGRWKSPRGGRRRFHLITDTEETRLGRAAPTRAFAFLIVFVLHTGLRKGELRALRQTDFNWRRRELRLEQSKTGLVKLIPLAPWLLTRLRRYVRPTTPWVFAKADGTPLSSTWIDARWQATRRAAGLNGIRFHDLRHTFASRLAAEGADPATVGELLGHKPPYRTTMIYFHPLAGSKLAAILRLARPPKSPPKAPSRSECAAERRPRSTQIRKRKVGYAGNTTRAPV